MILITGSPTSRTLAENGKVKRVGFSDTIL
jgi:hypothetical protein